MRGKLLLTAAALALAAFAGSASAQDAPSAPPTTNDQPSDPAAAARITPGTPVTGEINPAGEKDWYRLHVRSGRMYTITLNGQGQGDAALADPLLRIVSRSGEELALNDDSENSLNSRIQYIPEHSQDVFVEARAFGEEMKGAYVLAVAESALPPDNARGDSSTSAHIGLNQTVSGALDYAQDRDWFRVRLTAGQSYRFTLNGDASKPNALADPLLRLIAPDGSDAAQDDDGGEGLNSYLEYTATTTGKYFVEARSFTEDATGAYVLSAKTGDVPADVTTDAALSADGDSRDGMIAPAGDRDWYRLHLAQGQTVRIALDSADGAGIGDPVLTVYDAHGAQLAQDDDGGEGLNSLLEFTAPAAGDYFLEARGFTDSATGHYTISLTNGEIGAAADTADQLSADNEGRTSVLQTPNDTDWFAINLVEGRPYRFYVEGAGDHPLADPLLTLFDSDGHQVAQDNDGGTGVNAYLSFTSASGGVYYAAVSSFNAASAGQYSVRAVDTDVPGNTETDENLDATHGDDRAGAIEIPNDRDFYRVELQQGHRYEITLNGDGANPLTDPFLTIANSAGEQVTTDDDSGPGLNARLIFTAPSSDVFYLEASGLGGATGGYKIAINPQN